MMVRIWQRGDVALNPFAWTEWLAAAVRSAPFVAWRVELQLKRGGQACAVA